MPSASFHHGSIVGVDGSTRPWRSGAADDDRLRERAVVVGRCAPGSGRRWVAAGPRRDPTPGSRCRARRRRRRRRRAGGRRRRRPAVGRAGLRTSPAYSSPGASPGRRPPRTIPQRGVASTLTWARAGSAAAQLVEAGTGGDRRRVADDQDPHGPRHAAGRPSPTAVELEVVGAGPSFGPTAQGSSPARLVTGSQRRDSESDRREGGCRRVGLMRPVVVGARGHAVNDTSPTTIAALPTSSVRAGGHVARRTGCSSERVRGEGDRRRDAEPEGEEGRIRRDRCAPRRARRRPASGRGTARS